MMEYQKKLEENMNLFSSNTKPATFEEIENIENKYKISVPLSIKEFFLLVGNDYDCLFGGIGADRLDALDYNKKLAIKLLQERNVIIEKRYFVFSSYSDDQFMFVYLDNSADPPVYRFETELYFCGDDYIPGSSGWGYPKGVSKVADSFSSMIDDIVDYKIKEG